MSMFVKKLDSSDGIAYTGNRNVNKKVYTWPCPGIIVCFKMYSTKQEVWYVAQETCCGRNILSR